MSDKSQSIFSEKVEFAYENSTFIKLIISNKRQKSSDLNKINITPVKIKDRFILSFNYSYNTNDTQKNFELSEALDHINENINNFRNFDLFTTEENIQLIINKKGTKSNIKITEPTFKELPKLNHNREKKLRIKTEKNIYLFELGITNNEGKINKNMHDKFRQINKYLEIFESLLNKLKTKDQIKIADMGSGKGYLTFALYDFLSNELKLNPNIRGIEFRRDLVKKCNYIAEKCNYDNLEFEEGGIVEYNKTNTDILIALHACDTATDDAIFKGIESKAKLIIVAPCCQKQIRKQFNITNDLASILKYGILKERQAELITDGIRALLLEAYGYKTKVFEFISTEHTAKNVMITAELSSKNVNKDQIINKIKAIKTIFGIEQHYLEKLLNIS